MPIDYSGMSDEDFAKLDEPVESPKETTDTPVVDTVSEETPENTDVKESIPEDNISDGNTNDKDIVSDDNASDSDNDKNEEGIDHEGETVSEDNEEIEVPEEDTGTDKETLVVNGVETEFTVDELKTLAEQRLNNNKATEEYYDNKPIINALNEQGLLDNPDRLNLLIEAGNGNPTAIKQLLEAAKIDPLSLAQVEDVEVPQHISDAKTTYLNEVITELSSTSEFDIVSKSVQTFDDSSKEMIIENPDTLRMFTEDVKNGRYQKVLAEMTKRVSLGLMDKSLPKIEQYSKIYLDLFDDSNKEASTKQVNKPVERKTPPKGVRSSTRTSVPPQPKKETKNLDFLGMSDADFLKLDESKY